MRPANVTPACAGRVCPRPQALPRKIRDLNEKIEAARGHPEIFEKVRRDYAKKFRGFQAWQSALHAVQVAVDLPFDEGMDRCLRGLRLR